jgi:adenylate cyclase
MSQEVDFIISIIDKFIGDAVMAVFGMPDAQNRSELNGINCAVSILEKMRPWNDHRREAAQTEIHVTVGVHCGEVFAGAVGTESRMDFTVLGDAVNIAARLQEAAKAAKSGLVVSKNLLDRSGYLSTESQKWRAINDDYIIRRPYRISLYEYNIKYNSQVI